MADRAHFYDFGPFRIDTRERVLRRDGQPVSLTPKAFQTLLVLVRHSGHIVEKEQLMQEVWPATFVEEANLTQNIFALRTVLGGKRDAQKYIETVPRRGYRFAAPVKEVFEATPPATSKHGSDKQLPHAARCLAVLPFVSGTENAAAAYFADGITEGVIRSLSELPQLRVLSHSAVSRYKGSELDAMQIGTERGVHMVLVGKANVVEGRLLVSAELVDVATGWQLWGESYDCLAKDILEVRDEIAKQISAALRLKFTGGQERRLAKRYTENAEAYQAYLRARFCWSDCSRDGLERAIGYFREAIDLDPNYALAYAGIVDCYLRLATNYIPPADARPETITATPVPEFTGGFPGTYEALGPVGIRHEWDTKAAEREIRRATELKTNYPTAHQWYAAYLFSRDLLEKAMAETNAAEVPGGARFDTTLPMQIQTATLTPDEEAQVFCIIAREQIEAGNYEAACAVLQRWWALGEWPRLDGLDPHSSADLLFTVGNLAGCLASARQVPKGQKHAESLLNGSIALFEQLGSKTRSAEGRIELGYCYCREGSFELARTTLLAALEALPEEDRELRSLGLIRLAIVERHAGRLNDSLARLNQTSEIISLVGPWCTARYHGELATTTKELAIIEQRSEYFERALDQYREAFYEFKAIGNHLHAATAENNQGYLLLTLGRLDEAEAHLARARKLFASFNDNVRRAQVDETLAQLHLAAERFDFAEQAAGRAVATLEAGGEEALLAESLTTRGRILLKLGRQREAKRVLERAYEVAERCGDSEGTGRALLALIEGLGDRLEDDERLELQGRLERMPGQLRQTPTGERLQQCLGLFHESEIPTTHLPKLK